jgi:hypothetical protein
MTLTGPQGSCALAPLLRTPAFNLTLAFRVLCGRQYVELKKGAIRKALSRRRHAMFTYSNDFMSLNFPMVDEFRIRQVKRWVTMMMIMMKMMITSVSVTRPTLIHT